MIATPEGVVTAYLVHENGTYAEVWSVDTNTSVNCADFNSNEALLALGTTSVVVVVSIDYMDELYRFTVNEAVDGVAWDRDGDLWVTKRLSKNAIEWDGTASTLSGISTISSHTNGITDVVALSPQVVISKFGFMMKTVLLSNPLRILRLLC